jgi:hypothetical protein
VSKPTVILRATSTGEGLALPLVLAGYPKEIEGRPCHYRRKESIRAGDWYHRGTREPFSVQADRIDRWLAEYNRRAAAGIRVPVTKRHTDNPTADDTLGYAVALKREGESLYADLQLIGDDALTLAARNDVSICVVADGVDAKGNPSGEHIHHIALTPNPNQPHLGPFVSIAASAAGTPTEAPVFELCACGETDMLTPEQIKSLRAKLKLADDVKDADVAAKAVAFIDANAEAPAQVTALSASVEALKGERDAAKQQVLSLSATAPKQPDALTLSMYADNIAAKRESAVASGAVSEAEAKAFDALISDAEGKPNGLALSASAGGRPLAFALWDTVAKLGKSGVRTGNAVNRGTAADPPNHQSMSLSGTNGEQTPEQIREEARREAAAWQDRQLVARGLK